MEQDTSTSFCKKQRQNGDPSDPSNSFEVLFNLKDAPDYHQSKMKRNLPHGSGIIHPNSNSNEQILHTIPVIFSGDVQTKDSVSVINMNAFDMKDKVNGALKLNSAHINQLQCNNQHSKARKPAKDNGILNEQGYNSCKLPSHLPNLQKQMTGPKKLHDMDMNLNYTIPFIVNGQVSSSKSEKMSAISDKQTYNCDSKSPVNFMVTPCINNTEPFLLPNDANNV